MLKWQGIRNRWQITLKNKKTFCLILEEIVLLLSLLEPLDSNLKSEFSHQIMFLIYMHLNIMYKILLCIPYYTVYWNIEKQTWLLKLRKYFIISYLPHIHPIKAVLKK